MELGPVEVFELKNGFTEVFGDLENLLRVSGFLGGLDAPMEHEGVVD